MCRDLDGSSALWIGSIHSNGRGSHADDDATTSCVEDPSMASSSPVECADAPDDGHERRGATSGLEPSPHASSFGLSIAGTCTWRVPTGISVGTRMAVPHDLGPKAARAGR